MPFTNSPSTDTYSTVRVPLSLEINTRPNVFTTKDEDYLNCYLDVIKDKYADDKRKFITKRAGSFTFLASVAANQIRGMFFWADQQILFYAVNNDIYSYNLSSGVNTTINNPFGTTSGEVGFCEYLYDNNTSVIIATDGTTLIQIDSSNVVTTCVDADLPVHLPYPVFLDGYLFIVKTSSADIYNSDLNNPMAWTAGNFISAEIEGDFLRRIAKINNYLVAFGTNTIEYFWDAGVDTGSPLQRNDSVVKQIGYHGGFAQIGKVIYFLGNDTHGQPDVFKLEDLKIEPVGTPIISRYFNQHTITFRNVTGNIVSVAGRQFYVINGGPYTWVLDTEHRLWARWAYKDTDKFDMTYCVNVTFGSSYKPIFALNQSVSTLYYMAESTYGDDDVPFLVQVISEPEDFGTLNRKFMYRLSVLGDRPASDSTVNLYWSDDDYQEWSGPVEIQMNQDLPSAYRLGHFRQRAFKITQESLALFRIQTLEATINKGTA